MILEEKFRESRKSEKYFKWRKILYIGSESYDAPVITVIQGLEELGFEIYTIKKPNINSWFCNKIVNNPNENNYDFIISNLHWGTRWSYFKKYNLNCYPKILIDGDDNHSNLSWKEKYATYKHKYEVDPSENLKDKKLSSFRWVENMHDYLPDIVFTTQKKITDNCYYLPIGIKRDYFAFYENKSTEMREYDFTHIDGHGIRRKKMHWFLRICHLLKILPGKIFNGSIRGASIVPELIEKQVENDKNIHSYHRWVFPKDYYYLLNNSKVLIYPGILDSSQWDSKRPWEAYASGCMPFLSEPNIDVRQYPITEINEFAVYKSIPELVSKCRYMFKNKKFLEKNRLLSTSNAAKYFSPKPLSNFFLRSVHDGLS